MVWIVVPDLTHRTLQVLLFEVLEKRGGGWHPVTGGLEKGEDALQGAKREVQEETGFDPNLGQWLDLKFSHEFESRFGRAREHAFGWVLSSIQAPVIDSKEHVSFRWVSFSEALSALGHEAQREALRRVWARLFPA